MFDGYAVDQVGVDQVAAGELAAEVPMKALGKETTEDQLAETEP